MVKRSLSLHAVAVLAVLAAPTLVGAADPQGTQPPPGASDAVLEQGRSDAEFVRQVGRAHLAEIETSVLARDKTDDPEVRSYAEAVTRTFDEAQRKLAEAARSSGIEVPQQPGSREEQVVKRLEDDDTGSHDLAYVTQRTTQQQMLAGLYGRQARSGEAAEIRAFADEMRPKIERLLQDARVLRLRLEQERQTPGRLVPIGVPPAA
jgi:putative membrane protein